MIFQTRSSEMILMKCIWDAEEEISIPHLMEILREQYRKDYKCTTIVIFIARLQEKGYVKTCRKGSPSSFLSTKEESERIRRILDELDDE